MSAEHTALVLFCKPPQLSKSRLVPALGRSAASELAARLLACALEDAGEWPGPVVMSPADETDGGWARQFAPPGASVLPQATGNLGERLNGIDRKLRDEGHRRVLYIGIDCPLLDVATLAAAAGDLEFSDVVLGAARDGGAVFMGNSAPWPELARLPWSTARLGAALADACAAAGYEVGWHGEWADLDRPEDLPEIAAALAGDRRPARRYLAQWIAQNLP